MRTRVDTLCAVLKEEPEIKPCPLFQASFMQFHGCIENVKAPGNVKKEGTWGYLGTPRKVSRNACFFWGGAYFFGGVPVNSHLDTCATINELATHKKFCPLKKQALRTVKHVNLRHLDQHCARVKNGLF